MNLLTSNMSRRHGDIMLTLNSLIQTARIALRDDPEATGHLLDITEAVVEHDGAADDGMTLHELYIEAVRVLPPAAVEIVSGNLVSIRQAARGAPVLTAEDRAEDLRRLADMGFSADRLQEIERATATPARLAKTFGGSVYA